VSSGQLIAFEGLTREPTDGEFGRRIRATARSGDEIPPEQELRWFVEDRRAHVAGVIRPALAAGQTVLSDRYYLSTVAYQGARGGDPDRILADSEAEFPHPDLVLLLEIEPAAGLARVHARGNAVETRFEQDEFLAAVAGIFQRLDRRYIARIDASGEPAEVERAIAECVAERLGLP
jgi:dTMP kinase